MASRRTRLTITLSAVAVLLAGGVTALALMMQPSAEPGGPGPTTAPTGAPAEPEEPAEPAEPATPEPVRVIAMGDMLPHDAVNLNAEQADGSFDYAPFFDGIREQLDAADLTFCNQEAPSGGTALGISGYPVFNAPAEFARDLHGAAGCDLVSLANNHAFDKGAAGIAATREVWDALVPSLVSGTNRSADEQRDVRVFEVDGVRVAMLAFAEYSNLATDRVSLNHIGDTALVEELMAKAHSLADVVIVSAHWGTEYSHEPNAAQRAFAQQVADLGADVVIGHGPHVLQPVAWLDRAGGGAGAGSGGEAGDSANPNSGDPGLGDPERTLVWYSIGNMLSAQLSLDQRTGVIAGFDLVRDSADGPVRVANPSAILTYMHYDWSAAEEAAGALLARHNLSLTPLADSDELLERTRFGVSAAEQFEFSAGVLRAELGDGLDVRER